MKLHHIALVTDDLDRTKRFYEKLGFKPTEVFDIEEQYPEEKEAHRYRAVALKDETEGEPVIWLMQPTGEKGPLARFLKRRGPGFHHLGVETADVWGEAEKLRKQGISFVREPHDFPEEGQHRGLIALKCSDGVLVELVERVPRSTGTT